MSARGLEAAPARDMDPTPPAELKPGPLRSAFETLTRPYDADGRKTIYTAFAEADQRAVDLRSRHFVIAGWAARLGLAAISLALYQLAILEPGMRAFLDSVGFEQFLVEATLAAVTSALASLGLIYTLYALNLRLFTQVGRWRKLLTLAVFVLVFTALNVLFREFLPPRLVPMIGEFVIVVIACLAVFLGIWTSTHEDWIVSRSKAERLRGLRHRYLSAPALWGAARERQKLDEWLRGELKHLDGLGMVGVQSWLGMDRPDGPPAPAGASLDERAPDVAGDLETLRVYYGDTRLWPQIDYLTARSQPHQPAIRLTRNLPAFLFFAAALVVAVHFLIEAAHCLAELERCLHPGAPAAHPGPLSVLMLVLAVWLPALGASVRTWRLAQEFDRNALRFRAKAAALQSFAKQLGPDQRPQAVLATLAACEDVLESDHREWLRLMIEAEWFG